jgi:hypothetical protein
MNDDGTPKRRDTPSRWTWRVAGAAAARFPVRSREKRRSLDLRLDSAQMIAMSTRSRVPKVVARYVP